MEEEGSSSADKEPEVNNNNDSDDNEEYSVEEDTWIEWFCKMDGNHFFVEISHEFLNNKLNLIGIEKQFPNYEEYLETILEKEAPNSEILTEEYLEKMPKLKELYGLLHRRFLYTNMGLAMAREKFLNGIYGVCPRILCHKQTVLPYGISDELKYTRVNVSSF